MKNYLLCMLLLLTMCINKDPVVTIVDNTQTQQDSLKYYHNSDIIINEICSENASTLNDESNNDPDWVELYNKGDTAINLSGYMMSDDSSDLGKWAFGDVVINPKEYLIVFASGKDVDTIAAQPLDHSVRFKSPTAWSDSIVGGQSTVRLNEFSGRIYKADSTRLKIQSISAILNQVDNRPALDWSTANISCPFMQSSTDYSMYNTVQFRMTLGKDKLLNIRIMQQGIDSWKAPLIQLKGTGVENDIYEVPLVQGNNGLDLKRLLGISLETPTYVFTTTAFTLWEMKFTHSKYNLHTNFKLSENDGRIYLCRPDTVVADAVSLRTLPSDITFGRVNGAWGILKHATPGAANVQEFYTSVTQVPKSVTRGGFYDSPVSVGLQCNSGEKIHYTLDGRTPSESSQIYTDPFEISTSTVLRFAAISDGQLMSEVKTETFIFDHTTALPVVSLSTDPALLFDSTTGIYMSGPDASDVYPYFGANFWKESEIPIHIQFFETDKSEKFSYDAEGSIVGNWSRANAKKTIGIEFKEKYGVSELDYPLFPDHPNIRKFKKIVLRNNGGNYGRAMIEDPMMQSLMDNRNADYQKYRPVVLFINGKYFGLHQMMEPANVDYLHSNYGLQKENVDYFDVGGAMKQGTPENWNQTENYLLALTGDFTFSDDLVLSDTVYETFKNYVDVNNYIDYMAFQIYINNTDWPANNCRYWRNRAGGKWRWMIFDVDFGFGCIGQSNAEAAVSHNTLGFALDESKSDPNAYPNGVRWTFFLRALLRNEQFKADFLNRFATLMSTNFAPQRVTNRIDQMANDIKAEIPYDYARWQIPLDNFQNGIDALKNFANERPEYMYRFIKAQFNISGTYTLELNAEDGIVCVNDMSVPSGNFNGTYFKDIPLRLRAVPSKGKTFKRWSDQSTENPRTINPNADYSIEAIFE